MDGKGLREVIALTEIPNNLVTDWLNEECEHRGLTPEALNLDDLRDLLADILQSLILNQAE